MSIIQIGKYKRIVDVLGVLESLDLPETHVSGSNAMSLCPNPEHDDHTPSFGVHIETGVFNCYSCGYKGQLLQLVMDTQGVDEVKAERMMLRARAHDWAEFRSSTKVDNREFKIWPESVMSSFEKKYDYLESRGISRETQIEWEVHYNPEDNRYVIPVRHIDQNIIGFIGLADDKERASGAKKVLYTPNLYISKTMLGIHKLTGKSVILVEGSVDALKVYEAIRQPVVCAILHSNLSDGQAALLKRKGIRRVICMYDNDESGQKAMKVTLDKLGESMLVQRVKYDAEDPGKMKVTQIRDILIKKSSAT